jgi:hypothetical protein
VKSRQLRRYIATFGFWRRHSAAAVYYSQPAILSFLILKSPTRPPNDLAGRLPYVTREWRQKAVIRISQIHEGSRQCLLVEGTLSGDWVDVLENCWLETPHFPIGEPVRIDLSGVTYVDEKGRELLARMIQNGAELRATGVMTRAVIEEIGEKIAMAHNGQTPDGA